MRNCFCRHIFAISLILFFFNFTPRSNDGRLHEMSLQLSQKSQIADLIEATLNEERRNTARGIIIREFH